MAGYKSVMWDASQVTSEADAASSTIAAKSTYWDKAYAASSAISASSANWDKASNAESKAAAVSSAYKAGTLSQILVGGGAGTKPVWTLATGVAGAPVRATSPVLTSPTVTTSIKPTSDDGAPLGDTTHNFSDLFLASGAVINYAAGNVALTHTTGVLTLGTGTLKITTPTNTTTSVVTIDGTQTLTNKTLTSPNVNEAVALTSTSIKLNYLTSATGTTGTASTNVVFSTSPTLVTPLLGTPTSGVLTNCTAATAADNTATTALATTSFAKAEDAVIVNPKAPSQAVNMTAAASGSTGIVVADNDNIDFGTGNFSLVWRGSLPSWTASAILLQKLTASVGYQLETVVTTGYLKLTLNATPYTSSVAPGFVANTTHQINAVVTVGATTTVDFYCDGVLLGAQQTAANPGTVSSAALLYALGTSAVRTAGTCSFAATYNRALSAAEVLDLYRNGINYADKYGSQTALSVGATFQLGKRYRIADWVTDDDFTNIGGANVDGTEFVATSTATATHFQHSTVYEIGATLALEPEGIQPAPGQWLDSSTNKLHGLMPVAGASLTRQKIDPCWMMFSVTAASQCIHGNATRAIFPTENYWIDEIYAYAATSSVFSLGDDSTPNTATLVASTTLTAITWTKLTLLKNTTFVDDIYVTFTTAVATQFKIKYHLLTP